MDTPVKRLILDVALTQFLRDLGAGQFDAEIKGVPAVVLDAQMRKQGEWVGVRPQALVVEDMNPFG